ncbi:DUF2975 domain-containing protein [Brachybacterium sp. YJGR34]|uniref:DUF2975 domain-containing protein n=1 Tax=Brachybacterium sp. YJGR34 TaxID=2059911 RepID=UPI000E0BB980|nr:DUF2975 domain-containing protein [Brachybacterium sp. YJGR34]
MTAFARRLAQFAAVTLGLGFLLLTDLLPLTALAMGRQYHEVADAAAAYAVAAGLAAACGAAAMVAALRLITLAAAGRGTSPVARRWIALAGTLISAGLLLLVAVTGHLLVLKSLGGPGIVLLFLAGAAGLAATVSVTVWRRRPHGSAPPPQAGSPWYRPRIPR